MKYALVMFYIRVYGQKTTGKIVIITFLSVPVPYP
jgi:hypothetical protein